MKKRAALVVRSLTSCISKVGQNRISAPYMTVCMVISLLKIPCTPYIPVDVWFWPILKNIRCIYGIFGREITIHTVVYGVYIRFWPTLCIREKEREKDSR